MTKVYKINGKEIQGFEGRKIQSTFGEGVELPVEQAKINELLEALSDKEEVKQLTSLKEEIYSKIIDYSYQETTTEETVNEILKLIQSHLVKEVKYKPIGFECDEYNQGYNEGMRDIIKIINNIK